MREILFRAKRKDTGEWVEGNYAGDYDGMHYITQPLKNLQRLVPAGAAGEAENVRNHAKECLV